MIKVPRLDNEAVRIASINLYENLDKAVSKIIRDLILELATICKTPVVLIGYVKEDGVIAFEKHSTNLSEVSRDESISAYAILQNKTLIIPDLSLDKRFASHPLVTEESFRFYAGAPLITHDGYTIGALCVMDHQPRELDAEQIDALEKTRSIIMKHLEFQHLCMDVTVSDTHLSLLDTAPDAMIVINAVGEIIFVNEQTRILFGYGNQELIGEKVEILMPERFRLKHQQSFRPSYLKKPQPRAMGEAKLVLSGIRKDGSEFPVEISLSPIITNDGSTYISSSIRDITKRKRNEEALVSIATGVSSHKTGEIFFVNLVHHLVEALQADYAIIGNLHEKDNQQFIQTIAYIADGKVKNNATYKLQDTPCEMVVANGSCIYPGELQKLFPHDESLQRMRAESYAGTLLIDSLGNKLGLVNVLFRRPIENINTVKFMLKIVASRASTEMERIQTDEARKTSEELFYKAFHCSPDAMTISNLEDGRFIDINEITLKITGYSREEMLGRTSIEVGILDEDQRIKLVDSLQKNGAVRQMDFRLRMKSGETRLFQISADIIEGMNSKHILATHRDVTEAHRLSQQLMHLASHDPLTGLANRREFEIRLRRLINKAKDESSEHALCYLDLDQFKIVNDTCGHISGDELLRQVAVLIHNKIRQRDTLARLGGDEFGILMEYCDLEHAHRVSNDIRQAIEEHRFIWDKKIFSMGVSIGLVPINRETANITELLKEADVACYVAKKEGRNRIHIYKKDDQTLILHQGEIHWVSRINKSLLENRLHLIFQPILPLTDSSNGICYETLLRMDDDKRGTVLPGAFLPAAERYGLSAQIDRWVLQAVIQLSEQNPGFFSRISMLSINLSGSSLVEDDFLKFTKNLLERNKDIVHKICFEITETEAIANLSKATAFIDTLKEYGCRFALDDFGSGLSSFAYLKNLSVNYLKIDGIFIRDIQTDKLSLGIVKSIIEIGKQVGIKTIAEYIENEATLNILTELGADYGQGYYLGKPKRLELIPTRYIN